MTRNTRLSQLLRSQIRLITATLQLGWAHWDGLVDRVERQELSPKSDFHDEQVWTFLLASAYALAGRDGSTALASALTESQLQSDRIWFEVLPASPRLKEGTTHIDLALGDLETRPGTQSGIQFSGVPTGAICFCEFKWYSDISTEVSYDIHRNQFVRVIENALYCRRPPDEFPSTVHVSFVTPALFKARQPMSRLFQYKWREYNDTAAILVDLAACCLQPDASLPKPEKRIDSLRLHWLSYEHLLSSAPPTEFRALLTDFAERSMKFRHDPNKPTARA